DRALEFGLSKKDSDDKAVVVKRGLEKKCRDGWRPGVAPQGYLNDRQTESGFRKVLPDPERLPFIRKMFELFREGTTVMELYRMAKDQWGYRTRQKRRMGGRPLSLSMIYKILSNPFYCGKFEYPEKSGIWWKGNHEPAITEELFNEAQVLLGRRGKYTLQHHEYAFTSLLKCGFCGATITAEEKHQVICSACKWKFSITRKNKDMCTRCGTKIENMRNPTILHYTYYRCKRRMNRLCKQRGVRLDRLEQQIDAKLAEIEISPVFMDWALRQIAAMNDAEKDFQEDAVDSIKRAHDECRAKLQNLIQLKISPSNSDGSLLSDDQYRSQKSAIETELKGLEQQLGTIDNRMVQAAEDINEAFNFATCVRERFAKGDAKTKRRILMDLGSHLTLTDRTLHLDSPPYLFTLKKMKREAPVIGEMFAPGNETVLTTKMDAEFASIPTLLRGREVRPV
ncbi:MAG: recombinase family protein, partial [Nitrospirota bacterium]